VRVLRRLVFEDEEVDELLDGGLTFSTAAGLTP
jgi:hypothetical protein